MREMKDSGIEWIKQILTGWSTTRGKNILQLMKRPPEADDEVITCFRDGEVTLRRNRREDGFTFSDKEIGYQGIKKGDLVIHGMDGFAGAIGISDSDGKGSPVLVVCTTKENTRYLMYYLRTLAMQDVFLALATGIRERSCDLRWNKIADLLFPVPELNEQCRIADYLDRKCSQIDAIIARQQEVIEKLKAYKLSVITEAVTKGLNPHVPMKDSGIEWIGEIPDHWKTAKIRNYCSLKTGATPPTSNDEWFDGQVQWFTPGDFDVSFLLDKSKRTLSPKALECGVAVVAPANTVLIVGIGATAGKVGISAVVCSFNQQITALLTNSVKPKFLMYWLIANTKFLRETALFTTIPILNNQTIGNYLLIFPGNTAEEERIADYLDKKCIKIDSLITAKERIISKLATYKKNLVYEVVTGKKEV